MLSNELIALIDRYLEGRATDAEQEMIANYYHSFQQDAAWDEERFGAQAAAAQEVMARIRRAMEEEQATAPVLVMNERRPLLRRMLVRYAAAVILLLGGAGAWYLLQYRPERATVTAATDVAAPVNNRATITLPGGRQLLLADAPAGTLLEQNGVKIIKLADGRISYEGSADQVVYNTASNPKSSQPLQFELSDGTRVWLNAGSSLTYPIAFTGKERKVTLMGEGYFEVTHNAQQPFRVQAGRELIEDIGTSFNVNAYPDEAGVTTTLVEGAVIVGTTQLKPNQQYLNGKVSPADIPKALAWKNGQFNFGKNVSIKEVMRQLARWYDVDVVYEGNVDHLDDFEGKIGRNLSLKQVLDGIGSQQVHYRIEGRKVTIYEQGL